MLLSLTGDGTKVELDFAVASFLTGDWACSTGDESRTGGTALRFRGGLIERRDGLSCNIGTLSDSCSFSFTFFRKGSIIHL